MSEKLLAEWFWIDRWMGSSAFLLPMEARGVYREMLTQAWRRGARLPNDHEAIRRAIGATLREWTRSWSLIERFWIVEDGYLVNETQRDVYADAQGRTERASKRGLAGAQARHKRNDKTAQVVAQAQPEDKPPSPSLSPNTDHREEIQSDTRAPLALAGALPREHLRHGWCSARGKCVPDFLHQDFIRAVGGDERQAHQRLRAFYEAVEAGWPEGPIGDDPLKLWRKEFAAKFPSVAPTKTGTGLSRVTESALRAVREAQE